MPDQRLWRRAVNEQATVAYGLVTEVHELSDDLAIVHAVERVLAPREDEPDDEWQARVVTFVVAHVAITHGLVSTIATRTGADFHTIMQHMALRQAERAAKAATDQGDEQ